MGLKTSGETMQSLNNASRRCAHVSAIFSPPGFAMPKLGAGREAIVFTTRYVRQRGTKPEHTVGLMTCSKNTPSGPLPRQIQQREAASQKIKGSFPRAITMAMQQCYLPYCWQ